MDRMGRQLMEGQVVVVVVLAEAYYCEYEMHLLVLT